MRKFVMALGLVLSSHSSPKELKTCPTAPDNFYKSEGDRAEGHLQEPVPMNVVGNLFVPKNLDRSDAGIRRSSSATRWAR